MTESNKKNESETSKKNKSVQIEYNKLIILIMTEGI